MTKRCGECRYWNGGENLGECEYTLPFWAMGNPVTWDDTLSDCAVYEPCAEDPKDSIGE